MIRFDVLSLFPEIFEGALGASILRIARERGLADYRIHDFRAFAEGFHRKVDDRPFGGGPGMVLKPEPIFACLDQIFGEEGPRPPLLMMSPQGEPLNQRLVRELSTEDRLVILCGHYEGFDERIRLGLAPREISLGDYVLTGGELPALVLIDSIVRLRPGVLGDADSATHESFDGQLLDHPQFTRPVEFRGMTVPEVLRSGDHGRIAAWRQAEARSRTIKRRPDIVTEGPGPGDEAD